MLLLQSMMISFGILIGLSVECIYYQLIGDSVTLCWYHPVSILIAGALCSIPSLVLYAAKDLPMKKYRISIVLHFLFLFAVVMGMGYLFKWYNHVDGAIFVAIEYIGVYIFVWVASSWIGWIDQNRINDALDSIRDEE